MAMPRKYGGIYVTNGMLEMPQATCIAGMWVAGQDLPPVRRIRFIGD
jgi:hypothetical protein